MEQATILGMLDNKHIGFVDTVDMYAVYVPKNNCCQGRECIYHRHAGCRFSLGFINACLYLLSLFDE